MRFQNKKPQEIFVEKGWLKMTKDEDGNGMYLYMYLYMYLCMYLCEFGTVFVDVFSFPPPTLLRSFTSAPPPPLLLRLRSFTTIPSPLLLLLLLLATEIVTSPKPDEQKSKNSLALDLIRRKRELSEPAPMPPSKKDKGESKAKGDTKGDNKGDNKGDIKKPKLNIVITPP